MKPTDRAHRMEWWWDVRHLGHHAWWQRALLLGDMTPGREPTSWYCGGDDGRAFDPRRAPVCATCGAVPRTEDLTVVERATGTEVLGPRRKKLHLQAATDPETCWWCNGPGAEGEPPLCPGCALNLSSRIPGE